MTKSKKTKIDLFNVTNGPLWSLKGGWVSFLQSRGQKGPKIQFCHSEKSSWIRGTKLLPPLIWPKHRFSVHFWAISSGCFWEKSTFAYTHFSRKTQLVVLSKKSTECTNKLAVNCFQKSTNYVVPLSSRNLAFVNRMIVTINHRNNYSSSLHSSSLPSQLAGLCQLPQTILPSQYLWILNESTNTVLEAKIQRILLTLRQGASFTLPGLTIWAFY